MAMKSYTFIFESRIKQSPCVKYKEDSISLNKFLSCALVSFARLQIVWIR